MEIEIVCNADDEGIFTDVLHIVIKEGIDKEVKLRAKATGKTIFCNNDLDKGIDFGTQYTFKHQTKEIFIENKGRRDQKLEWVRKKPDKKKEDEDKNKLTTRKPKEKRNQLQLSPFFQNPGCFQRKLEVCFSSELFQLRKERYQKPYTPINH
jgi:hydrocephalus-inducing protein